jgi:hypothetical protein
MLLWTESFHSYNLWVYMVKCWIFFFQHTCTIIKIWRFGNWLIMEILLWWTCIWSIRFTVCYYKCLQFANNQMHVVLHSVYTLKWWKRQISQVCYTVLIPESNKTITGWFGLLTQPIVSCMISE